MTAFDLSAGPIPPRPADPRDLAVDAARELQQLSLEEARRARAERDELAARLDAVRRFAIRAAVDPFTATIGAHLLELLAGPAHPGGRPTTLIDEEEEC